MVPVPIWYWMPYSAGTEGVRLAVSVEEAYALAMLLRNAQVVRHRLLGDDAQVQCLRALIDDPRVSVLPCDAPFYLRLSRRPGDDGCHLPDGQHRGGPHPVEAYRLLPDLLPAPRRHPLQWQNCR